jgi:hypothetical protein
MFCECELSFLTIYRAMPHHLLVRPHSQMPLDRGRFLLVIALYHGYNLGRREKRAFSDHRTLSFLR